MGKDETAIAQDRKAAAWKVGVAVAMRAGTTVTNPWLAQRLNMGAADGVSRYVAETRRGQRPEAMQVAEKLGTTNIRV